MGVENEPKIMIEIIFRELKTTKADYEVVNEKRCIFYRAYRLKELREDPGLMGDIIRNSADEYTQCLMATPCLADGKYEYCSGCMLRR